MHRLSGRPTLLLIMGSLFLMFASACSDAAPQAKAEDLVGKWRFVTTGDYEGYINGSLKVAAGEDGQISCKLTVYQSEFGSAVERCRITMSGEEILIDIEEIVSSSVPNWRKEAFRLSRSGDEMARTGDEMARNGDEMTPSGDEMTGQVRIVVDFPVRFTRKK